MDQESKAPHDRGTSLPLATDLQVFYDDAWSKKYVVAAASDDPSKTFVALFDDQADWNESNVGAETIRRRKCKLFKLTTYSTVSRSGVVGIMPAPCRARSCVRRTRTSARAACRIDGTRSSSRLWTTMTSPTP